MEKNNASLRFVARCCFLIISSELDEVLDELKSENSAEDELEDGAYE